MTNAGDGHVASASAASAVANTTIFTESKTRVASRSLNYLQRMVHERHSNGIGQYRGRGFP